jgi:uncharacterized protein YutE (UPF0331/DUF86 family)
MKANKETLKQKMDVIDDNMGYLEQQKNSFDPAESGFGDLQAVKHCMLEIVEACIDIGSHMIASEGFEKPDDYSDIFPILADNDILGEEHAQRLSKMARFRNVLVHRYEEVENQKLQQFLQKDLEDVKDFNQAIYEYIDSE